MLVVLAPLLFLPATPQAAGDPEAGKQHFVICANCHGTNAEGNEEIGAPRLQGQHDWYLVRQLNNFKKGVRGAHKDDTYGHQMRQMVMTTLKDDKAIDDVVSYIDSLNK